MILISPGISKQHVTEGLAYQGEFRDAQRRTTVGYQFDLLLGAGACANRVRQGPGHFVIQRPSRDLARPDPYPDGCIFGIPEKASLLFFLVQRYGKCFSGCSAARASIP